MISGNCNRSPQYNAMGPPGGAQRYNPHAFVHQQHPQQHLLFMSGGGGNTRAFPSMSRGFSMMPNHHVGGVGSHPTVFQCNMQQGIGNSFGYHHANPTAAPIFHQQHHHLYQQPQIIQHHPQQPQYVPQQYIAPPKAASHNEPTSGFINGIKNMVKGIIHPLNCDFYSDHHKYYNPKYRNNYMRDIKAENMHYKPQHHPQSNSHVQTVVVGLEINKPSPTKVEEKKKPTTPTLPQECTKKSPEVVAIFSSDDFPELPAPRRSRSVTPAKTESTPPPKSSGCDGEKVQSEESPSRKHPPPKGTFFEVTIRTTPSGKRPTFGGRLKVVPPPFSLNKSPRSCRSRQESSCSSSTTNNNNNNKDCDIEEESFVIFSNNEKPGECMFTSFSRPPRQRKMSECSDDSFVVFFTEDADCLGGLQCIDDDDDLDELYDSDGSSDEEETSSEEEDSCDDGSDDDEDEEGEEHGIDVVDSSFLGRHNKTDRNKCGDIGTTTTTNSLLQQIPCDGVVVPREHKQLDSGFDEKKVTFDPHPVVHVMHAWNYAYRAARKGHWEDFARDRTRFQQRIERTSVYLNPVLTLEHREKIYHSRFCDEAACVSNQQQQQQSQQSPILTVDQARSHHRASASCNDDNQKLPKLTKLPDCASF
ncbi:uncharacterized protein LOC129920991 [Episyrphus balteatus]|uniref:uncharacterized protein LOC129920991 n=1 Tax=Episyrphus balteatus TaxID=286459 RepID=UPI002486391C|nr:uncharacterized protein LOC129920991 [Episyrphus balteatus]